MTDRLRLPVLALFGAVLLTVVSSSCTARRAAGHVGASAPATALSRPLAVTDGVTAVSPEASERAAPPCTDDQLDVTITNSTGVLGLARAVIVFRNVSSSTCSLSGYPNVTESETDGANSAPAAAVPAGYPPDRVSLGKQATASASVTTTSLDPNCTSAVARRLLLRVTAPNRSRARPLTLAKAICRPLEVHPIVSGSDGRIID